MTYKRVLVALDIAEENKGILEKAAAVAPGAELSLVHVVRPLEHVYGGFGAIGLSSDYTAQMATLEQQAVQNARGRLAEIGTTLSIPEERQHVLVGNPSREVHVLCDAVGADLIVLGTHGRHGLGLLLGSTANSVLHGVACDVLAVKINNEGA